MTLQVLVRPETENLVTLSLVKEELCIDAGDASQDARLVNLIGRASALFVRATDRPWLAQTVREARPPVRDLRMVLEGTPVLSLLSVKYDGEEADATTYSLESREQGFFFREDAWLGAGLPYVQHATQSPYPRAGEHLWTFDYRGGYYSPDSAKLDGTILDATQADPVVIESTAHARVDGDRVYLSGVGGMTQLNGNEYSITVVDADHYSLNGVDGTGFGAFTSGGTWDATPMLPMDVQDMVIEIVRYFYTRARRRSGIASESISGDYSVSYQLDGTFGVGSTAGPNGLPKDLEAQLQGYVRHA